MLFSSTTSVSHATTHRYFPLNPANTRLSAFDSPSEASSLACVKTLLSQLLERSVGDVALYEEVVHAFEVYNKDSNSVNLEASLWKALQNGLRVAERSNVSFVVLTDGEIVGGEKKALEFHNALRKCVKGLSHTRVVTFSAPVSHLSDGCRHRVITPQDLNEDIKTHFWQTLARSPHFGKLAIGTREQLIQDLAVKSKGSFLWAFYVGRLLAREPSHEALIAAVQSISSEVSVVLKAIVDKLPLKKDEALRNLISFMLVANRSLTTHEATALLTTNIQKRTMDDERFNIMTFVAEKCGDIVLVRGGQLHFRSGTVRSYMKTLHGSSLLSSKDAHFQLTLRLLLYARLHLDSSQDLMVDELSGETVDTIIASHHLLGYIMQNWIIHFKASSLITEGKVTLSKDFHDLFPDSVMFSLLERTCWHRGFSHQDYAAYLELSLQIRETCFGAQHVSVLQSLVTLGHVHHKILVSVDSAARYFYKAVNLGRVILTETSAFVASCTSLFLTCTEVIVITKRTEIVTYREEMIRLMIVICKHRHGESSDEVITWYEKLAQLYIEIKEEFRATTVYRELYAILVVRFGKNSHRCRKIGDVFGSLDIVLKGEEGEKGIDELEGLIFETSEDMEITDQICITMLLRLAHSYFACGKIYLAERLYVTLWRRISCITGGNLSIEVHIKKIQIALEYVKFLRKLKRTEEASNILICLWAEYEHFQCEIQSLIICIREIGTLCRSFGLLSIAVSIFTKVWGWFKGKGKIDDDEAQRTTILITEVVEEITTTTVTEKTTTHVTTEVTETVTREIFEHHFTRCKKTKVDKSFFSACIALIGLYTKDGKWSEAEVVIKRTLEITWKAILTADVKINLTEHWVSESIKVALKLALCYRHQGWFEKAEEIHLRIYHACFHAKVVEETVFAECLTALVEFYEGHHRHEKIIEIYKEVLVRYRKTLGAHHHRTIKILYLLAAQCELLGRKDTYEYYLEIVTVLNKGLKHCHHDAFKAALFLCRYYHSRKMHAELRQICVVVWETIVQHHHHKEWEVTIEMEIITEIYEMYRYVLEVHAKVEFKVLYELTVQYKETVTVIFGAASSKVLIALIALAKICEKSESHYHESVTIYEEVIKKTTTIKTTETTITERTVQTVKTRLSKMYVTIITSGKAGKAVEIDRAIEICIEAYASLKIEFGCWHEKTLLKLKDIVILYQKVATQAAHARMVQLLQIAVTEVITTLTITTTLFTAAQTLASIYVSVGLVSQGQDLLHQLRHLIIFHGDMPLSGITLKLDVRLSKVAFAFLIAYEQALLGKSSTVSYSIIMADIIYESVLYEEYSRVIETNVKLEVLLECSSKLRCFWAERKRTELLVILDKKLLHLFKTGLGAIFDGTSEAAVRHLYLCVLLELGKDRQSSKFDFDVLFIRACNAKVKTLLIAGDFQHAYEVSRSVFRFASKQQLYRRRASLQFGYKLAEFLAGIDVPHPTDGGKQDLKKAMMALSRDIMTEVLAAFRAEKTDFSSLRYEDLAGLIRLLGAQGNFGELEVLLSHLWGSRELIQRANGWSPGMVLQVGKLLVQAQYAHGNASGAIDTAELLYYNMRRGRGRLDAQTLAVARLLASLYTSERRMTSAMGVHEAILRELVSASQHDEDSHTDHSRSVLVAETKRHLELLRAVHHRMQGWTKPVAEYRALYSRLTSVLKLDLPAFEQWLDTGKERAGKVGTYVAPQDWKIEGSPKELNWKRSSRERTKSNVVHAASQLWLVH